MKNKKLLYIVLIALDMLITGFLFVFAIIMLANTIGKTKEEILNTQGFIGYLQQNPNVYGLAFVVPLFILLAANIVILIVYVRRTAEKKQVQMSELSDAQKEALKAELLRELTGGSAAKAEPSDQKTEK